MWAPIGISIRPSSFAGAAAATTWPLLSHAGPSGFGVSFGASDSTLEQGRLTFRGVHFDRPVCSRWSVARTRAHTAQVALTTAIIVERPSLPRQRATSRRGGFEEFETMVRPDVWQVLVGRC